MHRAATRSTCFSHRHPRRRTFSSRAEIQPLLADTAEILRAMTKKNCRERAQQPLTIPLQCSFNTNSNQLTAVRPRHASASILFLSRVSALSHWIARRNMMMTVANLTDSKNFAIFQELVEACCRTGHHQLLKPMLLAMCCQVSKMPALSSHSESVR